MTAANLVEQGLRRGKDYTDDQAGRTGREADKLDKKIDRKMQGCEQKMDKLEDFLLQKLDFLKMEIESDLSCKTTQMLEQYYFHHLETHAKNRTSVHPPSTTSMPGSARCRSKQSSTSTALKPPSRNSWPSSPPKSPGSQRFSRQFRRPSRPFPTGNCQLPPRRAVGRE